MAMLITYKKSVLNAGLTYNDITLNKLWDSKKKAALKSGLLFTAKNNLKQI